MMWLSLTVVWVVVRALLLGPVMLPCYTPAPYPCTELCNLVPRQLPHFWRGKYQGYGVGSPGEWILYI